MDILTFTLLVWLGSFLAGFLGALTGLGGGVVIVPFLTLAFGVDIRYAIGASLVSVIATSSGSAAAYTRRGLSNIRIGMFLEIATTVGALAGAALTARIPAAAIAFIFGVILLYSAYASSRPPPDETKDEADHIATYFHLDGSYLSLKKGMVDYHVHSVPEGFSLMFLAGALSGLLGIGSGAIKVLAMDRAMHIPFKVSTTTSNFMIGVTAAAGAGVFLSKGYIDPGLAMPVMLGVLPGSMLGARVLLKTRADKLRLVFAVIIALLGVEMIYNGLSGRM